MVIFWLDDDSPGTRREIGPFEIFSTKTCSEGNLLFQGSGDLPRWCIVDFIVPQDGWGDEHFDVPGIEFIKHIKREHGSEVRVVAFGIAVPSDRRDQAIAAGAEKVFEKTNSSFVDILRHIACQDELSFSYGDAGVST